MKGFFIFLAVIVSSAVAFMGYYQEIGQWYMEKVVADEGGPYPNATFDKMKIEIPEAFKAKFESDLRARMIIAKFADWTSKEAYFLKIVEETKTMYLDSSLVQKDGFGDLIFKLAEHYHEADRYLDAYNLFKLFVEIYPNHPDVPSARRYSEHLRVKYSLG